VVSNGAAPPKETDVSDGSASEGTQGSSPLRGRVVRSGLWTLIGYSTATVIRFAANLLITRLLAPEAFGIVAIANVILMGLAMFTELGLRENIIQSRRGDEERYLNTVWTIQILRNVILFSASALMGGAVWVAQVFHLFAANSTYANPELPLIIVVLSTNILISGFESTRVGVALRKMDTMRVTFANLGTQLFYTFAMLLTAWLTHSVWALVIAVVASSIATVVMSYTVYRGIPNRLAWDREAVREVFHFGKWLFLSTILGVLATSGDRVLLGGLISAKEMGLYATATMLMSVLVDILGKLGNGTVYPALSEVHRRDPEAAKKKYYQFRAYFDATTLFLAGLVMAAGQFAVDVLYDGRYHQAGVFVSLLAVSLLEFRFGVLGTYFMAIGRPKNMLPTTIIRLVTIWLGIPVAFHFFGVNGAVLVVGLSSVVTMPMSLYQAHRAGVLRWSREVLFLPMIVVGYGAGLLLDWAGRPVLNWILGR